jgi:hypothetical protein
MDRVTLTDSKWRLVKLPLQPANRRYAQLDLRVSPTWSYPNAQADTPDTKEMGVMVGEPVIP